MEQTYEDLIQNLKCENENSKMDIEGIVIKVELIPSLIQNQKPKGRPENENQNKNFDKDHYAQSRNSLLIEETTNIKLGIEKLIHTFLEKD